MKRKHIPLKTKLAAALYEIASIHSWVPWRKMKMSADFVIAQFDFHHEIFHAHGGTDDWHNLTPILHLEHRERTKRDLATIAKGKRIQRKQAEHQARMEAKKGPPYGDSTKERRRHRREMWRKGLHVRPLLYGPKPAWEVAKGDKYIRICSNENDARAILAQLKDKNGGKTC